MRIADSPALDITDEITVMAWINTPSPGGHRAIVTKGWEGGNWGYLFQFYNGARIGFYTNPTGWDTSTSLVPAGRWVHLAVTYDRSYKRFYIDGDLDNSSPDTAATMTNNAPLRIGRRSDGWYFDGIIGEIAIFDRALDEDEIRARFQGGRP